ncbi:RDD family protein [Cellulomonas alba]|uniref:RDD family protein n=1 Tax=Cellulomonas alba TaxID=3053467 RepID=A0ABT7SC47_9CELL|nr:RDD family protein [Cellulomonas alba]MDM7853761.1 RDD family protein [Cellulomonas alba]
MTDPQHARDPRTAADDLYAPAVDHAPRPGRPASEADLASYPRRVGAFVVDLVLAFAASGWVALVVRPADGDALPVGVLAAAGGLGVVLAVVQWVLHGRRGWTFGRLLTDIRTVDAETRRPIGMGRVLVRGLVVAAGALACLVGAFLVLASPLVDPTGRRRGWHDRAARDEVLDARALRPGAADDPAPTRAARAVGGVAVGGSTSLAPDVPDEVTAGTPAAPVPAWASSVLAPTDVPALRPWSASAQHEMPAVTGSLRLAPLAPQRSGPDLDTRAIPVVRAASAPAGSAPAGFAPDVPTPGAAAPDAAGPAGAAALAARAAGPVQAVAEQVTAVAPVAASAGTPSTLDPELELTHRAVPRPDALGLDDVSEETLPFTGPETAEIELSDGRRLYVERTALVGRNPVARTNVRAIRVHDPNRSVSKTHLQIGVEPGGVWVADRGSTNGTVVTLPDGGQVRCGVDQRVRLRVGSVVVFGDCALRLVRGPGSPPAP